MGTFALAPRPALRGHFHYAGFFISLGACAMLIARATTRPALFATIIYSLGLQSLFGVSALYHRLNWTPEMRLFMRRLDHAAIFLFISTSATAVTLLGLQGSVATHLLILTWSVTVIGVVQKFLVIKTPRWVSALTYIFAGWIIEIYLPDLRAAIDPTTINLLVIGGITYSVGALVYVFKRPNPFPRLVGYHEIFHFLVNVGALFHFISIYRLVIAAK